MSLLERLRRRRKPAEHDEEHPLSDEEREAERGPTFTDELAKLDTYTVGGGPINPEDELRQR